MLLQALHCCTEVNSFKDMKTLNLGQNSSEDVHLLSVLSLFLLFKNWIHAFPILKNDQSLDFFANERVKKYELFIFWHHSFVTIKNRLQNAMWASFAIKNEETMHSEPPNRKLYPWAQYGVKVRFLFAWHDIFYNISTFSHFKRKWTSSEELCAEFKIFRFWKKLNLVQL